jgi:hypothetical protein
MLHCGFGNHVFFLSGAQSLFVWKLFANPYPLFSPLLTSGAACALYKEYSGGRVLMDSYFSIGESIVLNANP